MKTNYKLVLLLFFISAFANAQTMDLRLSTYFYSWERADSTNPDFETSHLARNGALILRFWLRKILLMNQVTDLIILFTIYT